jgi:hypothetical protein
MNTFDRLFNKHNNTNYLLYTPVYTMMMVNVKWPKRLAAIYKCYIKLVD